MKVLKLVGGNHPFYSWTSMLNVVLILGIGLQPSTTRYCVRLLFSSLFADFSYIADKSIYRLSNRGIVHLIAKYKGHSVHSFLPIIDLLI